MHRLAQALVCCVAVLSPAAACAADFDGSRLLICAPTEAMELRPGRPAVKQLPHQIGAPSFLRVDIANKQITGPKRVTPIRFIEKDDAQFLLQGTELGFGWTLALDRQLGDMVLSFVDGFGAVVLSGRCTPA